MRLIHCAQTSAAVYWSERNLASAQRSLALAYAARDQARANYLIHDSPVPPPPTAPTFRMKDTIQ